jgi:ubiquinone/menaquinone biosynthesis C-methylase UbiE
MVERPLPGAAHCAPASRRVNHKDYVSLLRPANLAAGGHWADMGAGSGAFTFALRELIGPDAIIHAVDKDASSLASLEQGFQRRFHSVEGLQALRADIGAGIRLGPLDGILMANSLHFFPDKESVLGRMLSLLKPGGWLLLVEYNVDRGNAWVPFPLSYSSFERLASKAGFSEPRLLATHASNFLREFYSASARA